MKFTTFICLLLSFSITSCNYKSTGSVCNVEIEKHTDHCSLIMMGEKSFPLDENTPSNIEFMQYIGHGENDTLAILNPYDNSIYYYDYDSTNILSIQKMEKEGNNGVGQVQGFYYVNKDSIFTYSDLLYTASLINSKSQMLWHKLLYKPMTREGQLMSPAPWIATVSPIKYVNNKLIMNGFLAGEPPTETLTNRPVTLVYDFMQDTISYRNNYPVQYMKSNWGGGFYYRWTYWEVCGGKTLVSFPADHYLRLCSIDGNLTDSCYAGSKEVEEIFPYSSTKPKKDEFIDENLYSEWYAKNASYGFILYDKYRRLFYRMVYLPKSGTPPYRPLAIIVLDENLNYIGEDRLSQDVANAWTGNAIVTKDGLSIMLRTDDEDKLVFNQYEVKIDDYEE